MTFLEIVQLCGGMDLINFLSALQDDFNFKKLGFLKRNLFVESNQNIA